jgi:tRNA pseudouridine38-40 synthase
MRYFLRFAYIGTDFHGSQVQPNGVTVQETMEQALATILRQPVSLTFAGRTDAGVHAKEMYAHMDYDALPDNLIGRLNSLLPDSIAVYEILQVSNDMHARFSALSRTYEYHITEVKDPFSTMTATRVAPGLDFEAMNDAAQLLLGRHDFASFCRVHTDVKTTFCTVIEAYWKDGVFTITADRFLRNMVRAIVGTLFDVGRGKLSIEDFQSIIDAKSRAAAGQSAPPQGLFLTHIKYDI